MIDTLAVANYRSLRSLVLPLVRLNVVTGPNGSGKSNLYRALRLLAEAARGRLVPWLAREGGLPSTLWAGPERVAASVKRGEHPVQGKGFCDPYARRSSRTERSAISCGLRPSLRRGLPSFWSSTNRRRACIRISSHRSAD